MGSNNEKSYKDLFLEVLTFENKASNELKEIDSDESKNKEEKEKLKDELKKKKKVIETKKDDFFKSLDDLDIGEMTEVVEALQQIYFEQRELKPLTKKLLTNASFRRKISAMRKNDFRSAYGLIAFISDKFPVDDYPMYTLKPNAPLYGSEVEKTSKSSTHLPPLSNDEILKCLEVYAENDKWALYGWVMAIFAFDENNMIEAFKDKYLKERQELLLRVIDKTKKEKKIQDIISEKLFEKGDLARLVNLQVKGLQTEVRVKELEENVAQLNKDAEYKESSYWERAEKQKSIIDEKQAAIDVLQAKLKKYDELALRLDQYIKKYEAQVSMNERITIVNDIRVHEMEDSVNRVEAENTRLITEISEIKAAYENVQSDLILKIAEIKRLSEYTARVESKAKDSVLQELISSVKEQLYYINLYYMELTENGNLEKESIDMFGDTISNIDNAFKTIGIEKIGVIDEVVKYDSALHDAIGEKMSNGEKAILRVPGWKVNGEVCAKAQVEKEI